MADDDPSRQEIVDLGKGLHLSSYLNKLRPVSDDQGQFISAALQMYKTDHLDIASQQNKTARIMRLVTIAGFVMIATNIIVITEMSNLGGRILLGGASALGVSVVYYLRSTLMPANRDLLSHRRDIRASTAQLAQLEGQVEMLTSELSNRAETFRVTFKQINTQNPPDEDGD